MISVRRLLELPGFLGSSVLAGQKGLDRKIEYIDVLEVPDAENWLAPHEFLLTTAFAFKSNERGLKRLIEIGAERNVAGFGIKLGRFIDTLYASTLETADSYSIPLISLPLSVSYKQIIKDVMCEIIKSEESIKKNLSESDVLNQLLEEEAEDVLDKLESYGWVRGMSIRIGFMDSLSDFREDDITFLRQLLSTNNLKFILVPSHHDDIVILFQNLPLEIFYETFNVLQSGLKDKKILLGLSEPRPLTIHIKRYLNEAKTATKLAKALGLDSKLIPFSQVQMLSIILEHPQLDDLVSAAVYTLSPLLQYDANHGSTLLKTLKVFLESEKNQQVASSILNIHRNTLRYRLQQIEGLLGDQFTDTANAFILRFALFIYSMFRDKTNS